MSPTLKLPTDMTVAEFLAWCPEDAQRWQLVDGEPVAMAPTRNAHGALQGELAGLLRDHFRARNAPCRAIVAPGIVPRMRSAVNFRIPDLGVVCGPYAANELDVREPVLLIEILSPSNARQTRANLWAYVTIPSVQEILLLHADKRLAELMRRGDDGAWPDAPMMVSEGELELASVGLKVALAEVYRAAGVQV